MTLKLNKNHFNFLPVLGGVVVVAGLVTVVVVAGLVAAAVAGLAAAAVSAVVVAGAVVAAVVVILEGAVVVRVGLLSPSGFPTFHVKNFFAEIEVLA